MRGLSYAFKAGLSDLESIHRIGGMTSISRIPVTRRMSMPCKGARRRIYDVVNQGAGDRASLPQDTTSAPLKSGGKGGKLSAEICVFCYERREELH